MGRSGRKRVGPGSRNPWVSALDRMEGAASTQAGEVPSGLEDGRGGGDKGRDVETGSGGYSADAVEAGVLEAGAQVSRPADAEIHGDPRTHEGSSYPDEAKISEEGQRPVGQTPIEGEIREG